MITQSVFEQAKKTPEHTAVVYNDKALSYRAFAHSIALARGFFASRGYVGSGYAVLAFSNLLDFWILSLALRSLGLTTVSVPNAVQLGRLNLPNIRCVVFSPHENWPPLESVCLAMGVPLVSVTLDRESALDMHAVVREQGRSASEFPSLPGGHILHTSGTTGDHKMVLMTPALDRLYLPRCTHNVGLDQSSRLCIFDFPSWTGVGYRWGASTLMVGGTIVINQGRETYKGLLDLKATHAVVAPEMLARVLAAPPNALPRNPDLQLTVCAGSITHAQADQVRARLTPHIKNWLAATEVSAIAYTPLNQPEDLRWHRLIAGIEVEIVDEFDRAVPTGVTGRLRVACSNGIDGYIGDDAATQSFFRHGFFYPGDLAVLREDGRLALQGRLTSVINMAGHKISPEPIESRLMQTLGVSAVCLFSMQDESGEEELHVVIEAPQPVDAERLQAALASELQWFPRARIYCFNALARNEIGKILRMKVRAQVLARLQNRNHQCH